MKLMSRALLGAGAANLLPNCATTAGVGGDAALPPATKANPFVNSLGMKFVPVPGTKILMCTTETTVSQYQAMGRGYQAPGFPQSGNHPAVNVSWNDAKAWCKWLSEKEGRGYRLPTDKEWSAAAGSGAYPWGNSWPPSRNAGNFTGQEVRGMTETERRILNNGFDTSLASYNIIAGYGDHHKFTAPVGSYSPNQLGIFDLGGNVWEFCEDLLPNAHPDIRGARITRGGGWKWGGDKEYLSSSRRNGGQGGEPDLGFRCVLG